MQTSVLALTFYLITNLILEAEKTQDPYSYVSKYSIFHPVLCLTLWPDQFVFVSKYKMFLCLNQEHHRSLQAF